MTLNQNAKYAQELLNAAEPHLYLTISQSIDLK